MFGFFREGRYPNGRTSRLPNPANGAPQYPQRGVLGSARSTRLIARLVGWEANRQYASQSAGVNGSPWGLRANLISSLSARR